MKASELRNKSKAELNEMLLDLLQQQFQLRMNKGMTENPKHHLPSQVRKNVARIKTVLNSK